MATKKTPAKKPAKAATKKPAAKASATKTPAAKKATVKTKPVEKAAPAKKVAEKKPAEKKPAQMALSVNDVDVGYNGIPVIRNISLQIPHGQTFGLIGLNGVGKTTLIKSILGLRDTYKGHIEVFGIHSWERAARNEIAYLPERFDPPWFLTGYEFIEFSSRLYNHNVKRKDIHDLCDRLNLDREALKRRANTYSKGMRQKLGLIATVLTPCRILLLDEPMSGLDPMARVAVKDVLILCKEKGKTVFLSSHILADLDELCQGIAVMHGGMLPYKGTPEGLKQQTGHKTLERAFLHLIMPP
ncbi:MAG: ATP-binding cassette domain-containing protein, partial [Pseudobdellovibrionaceae bacterium]